MLNAHHWEVGTRQLVITQHSTDRTHNNTSVKAPTVHVLSKWYTHSLRPDWLARPHLSMLLIFATYTIQTLTVDEFVEVGLVIGLAFNVHY